MKPGTIFDFVKLIYYICQILAGLVVIKLHNYIPNILQQS